VSYLILRRFATGGQTPILAAALAVFGFADVPFVYLSIWYFRTQHPQPVIGGGGSLHPAMWHALLYNWLAFSALAACCAGSATSWSATARCRRNAGPGIPAGRVPEIAMNPIPFLYAAYIVTWSSTEFPADAGRPLPQGRSRTARISEK